MQSLLELLLGPNTEPTVALNSPADSSSTSNTTPTVNFTGTDGNGDAVEYEVQICNDNVFPLNISDNFNDNSFDTSKWTQADDAGGTITESGQKIILTPPNSATGYLKLDANGEQNLVGSAVQVKILQLGSVGYCNQFLAIQANDYSNAYSIGTDGTNLKIGFWGDGSLATIAWNATTMAYWRIYESGGTIYFQYSQTGTAGSWTTAHSEATAFPLSNVWISIEIDENISTATPGAAWFDDFNIIPSGVFIDALSASNSGFTAGHPFASGSAKDYTVQSALSAATYYWRVRAKDPTGSNQWGAWSSVRSIIVTSSNNFIIADESSAPTIENITLTFNGGNLISADEVSSSSIENIVISRNGGDFAVADESSASSIENVTLIGELKPADEASASSIENVQLIGELVAANESSASSIENIVISRNGGDFAVADESSASSIENVTLIGELKPADEASASSIENIAISRNGGDFALTDENSTSSIENVILIGDLKVSDEESISFVDNIVLSINGGDFILAGENSSSSIENVQLIGDLKIADELSASSINNIALERSGGDLIIADSQASSSIENIILVGEFLVANESSVSTIEGITLETGGGTFSPADIQCSSTIDNVGLEGNFIIDGMTCTPSVEGITIIFAGATFIVNNIDAASTEENISLIGNFKIDSINSPPLIENIELEIGSGDFVINGMTSASSIRNITIIKDIPDELKIIFIVNTGKICKWVGGNKYLEL